MGCWQQHTNYSGPMSVKKCKRDMVKKNSKLHTHNTNSLQRGSTNSSKMTRFVRMETEKINVHPVLTFEAEFLKLNVLEHWASAQKLDVLIKKSVYYFSDNIRVVGNCVWARSSFGRGSSEKNAFSAFEAFKSKKKSFIKQLFVN